MQGNSLISEFLGINFDIDKEKQSGTLIFEDKIDPFIKQFHEKKNKFLNEPDRSKKEHLREEIENLIINIFEEKLRKQKSDYFSQLKSIEEKYSTLPNEEQRNRFIGEEKEKLYKRTGFNLEQIEKQLKEYTSGRKTRPFFPWKLYFAEVFHQKGGFDVVIANPPYVRQERIREEKPLLQKAGYEIYNSTSDLYTYFYEKSWNILKSNGFSCFISSNKWMRSKYGRKLRYFLKNNCKVVILIDFNGYSVFEATVDTNIILFKKTQPNKEHKVKFVNVQNELGGDDIISFIEKKQNIISQIKLDDYCWTLADERILKLKEKIESIGELLKDLDVKIYYGIKTGFNKAFIIDNETKERLCKEDPKSAEILKPILRGRDIGRYYYKWAGLWLIATFPALHLNIDKYPAIKRYLLSFGIERLEQSGETLPDGTKARKKTGNKWFETQDNIAYYPEFEKEKIVWQRVTQTRRFSIVPPGIYSEDTTHFITGQNLRYLLAVLNSVLFEFVFYKFYQGGGIQGEIKGEFIKRFPIPQISNIEQQPFIDLVNKILPLSQSDDYLENPQKQVKVKEYERQIDQLVYQLYGLTEEEIRIIEGKDRI